MMVIGGGTSDPLDISGGGLTILDQLILVSAREYLPHTGNVENFSICLASHVSTLVLVCRFPKLDKSTGSRYTDMEGPRNVLESWRKETNRFGITSTD